MQLSLKEHKSIVLTTVSLPLSSSLLKVPNDDDGGVVGGIGSRDVMMMMMMTMTMMMTNITGQLMTYNITEDMFPLFIKSVKEKQ